MSLACLQCVWRSGVRLSLARRWPCSPLFGLYFLVLCIAFDQHRMGCLLRCRWVSVVFPWAACVWTCRGEICHAVPYCSHIALPVRFHDSQDGLCLPAADAYGVGCRSSHCSRVEAARIGCCVHLDAICDLPAGQKSPAVRPASPAHALCPRVSHLSAVHHCTGYQGCCPRRWRTSGSFSCTVCLVSLEKLCSFIAGPQMALLASLRSVFPGFMHCI